MPDFLKDFVDTHLHAGPSLLPRYADAWDVAELAQKAQYRAIVIKDHCVPTMALARLVEDHLSPPNLKVFGSIALNNASGGINPEAVEVALNLGARVVWMPTISARNHMERYSGPGIRFPSMGHGNIDFGRPLSCLEEDGNLTRAAHEVIEVILAHPDTVLATGHISCGEVDVLVRAAFEAGLEKVLVTHPHFLVGAGLQDMRNWRRMGAYLEFTAIISVPSSPIYCRSAKAVASLLEDLGPEQVVLSSDYGILEAGNPIAGMHAFYDLLSNAGISHGALQMMTKDNPARLLGI